MLDMIMPKKTGMEALEEIKDIRSGVKALFLSGYTADRIQEMTAEGVEIVMKPISPRDLVRTVRKVLESKP
jgi:polar amino acid transport system substrate-binding protein